MKSESMDFLTNTLNVGQHRILLLERIFRVQKHHSKTSTIKILRPIIDRHIKYNLPMDFYQIKSQFLYRLRNKYTGAITLDLYKINYQYKAEKLYIDMCKRKTKNWQPLSHDSGSLDYHIKKFGVILGPEKYKESCFNKGKTTRIQYFIDKGLSEEDAKTALKERQSTFSLEKCIDKHGEVKGLVIFNARQEKWQKSLKDKSQEEIDEINIRKNPAIKRHNETKLEFKERLSNNGESIFDEEDLRDHILTKLEEPRWKFLIKQEFLSSLKFAGNSEKTPEQILDVLGVEFPETNIIRKIGLFYVLNVDEGYLRSSIEIGFYYGLKDRNIEFVLEKRYNMSTLFKSDFYIVSEGLHIEIAGMVGINSYDEKMQMKRTTLGALILYPNTITRFFEILDDTGFIDIFDRMRIVDSDILNNSRESAEYLGEVLRCS